MSERTLPTKRIAKDNASSETNDRRNIPLHKPIVAPEKGISCTNSELPKFQ